MVSFYRFGLYVVFSALFILHILACPPVEAADSPQKKLSVVYCEDCAPFQFQNQTGDPDGMIIDIWKLWSKNTRIEVDFRPAPWDETLTKVRNGEVDAHAGLFYTKERDAHLLYGSELSKTDTHVFFHQALPMRDGMNLLPYRVGVLSGDTVEGWLKQTFPNLSVVGYPDYKTLMTDLSSGALQVFAADTLTGLHHLQQAGLAATYAFKTKQPLYRSDWFFAVKKGDMSTLNRIQQGMDEITDEQKRKIARSWSGTSSKVDADTTIIAIDRNYPPFSFLGLDGNPTGMLVEMWEAWSQAAGVKIAFKPLNWADTLEAVKSGVADIHFGLFMNKDREKWFDFSPPLHRISSALYILSEKKETFLSALLGKRVAVLAGSYQEKFLRAQYPEVKAVPLRDGESMLVALIKGEVEALLHEIPMVEADLNKLNLNGVVKRGGDPLFANTVHAGVKKDAEGLLSEIDKGFEALGRAKLSEIEARWISNPADRYYEIVEGALDLTDEERDWISNNPTIRVAATPNWPPFEFKQKGAYKGLHADIVRLAAQKAGLEVEPVFGKWSNLVDQLKNGQLDLCPGLNNTDERRKYLVFTEDWVSENSEVIIAPTTAPVESVRELFGKTVAVEKGYATEAFLKENFPEVNLLLVGNTLEALKAVITGKAAAYCGNQAVALYFIKKDTLSGLEVTAFFEEAKKSQYRIGVIKSKPLLRDILQKALVSISTEEMTALQEKWFGVAITRQDDDPELIFTDEERVWLQEHPTIRMSTDTGFKPIDFIDEEGTHSGIASEYVDYMTRQLGVDFEYAAGLTWSQVLAETKAKNLDFIACISPTPERNEFLLFTKPYLSFPVVIFAEKSTPFISGLEDLADKRVAVVQAYYTHEVLKNEHPDLELWPFPSAEEAITALSTGKVDYFVNEMATSSFTIDALGLTNLKVAASTPYNLDLCMGVRKDWPELVTILNKALAVITPEMASDFKGHWFSMTFEHKFDFIMFLKWGLPVAGVLCIIILVVVAWNRRLGREVAERKAAEHALSLSEVKYRGLVENANSVILKLDKQGRITFFNEFAQTFFGYSAKEIEGKPIVGTIVAGTDSEGGHDVEIFIQELIKHPECHETSENENVCKNGERVWVSWNNQAIFDDQGEFVELLCVGVDITKRRKAEQERDDAFEVITSSIQYASRIQRSILPDKGLLERVVPDHFILWKPRDVVGGDIYWTATWGEGLLIILGDCTGHGVPGAFMTLISSGAFERALQDVSAGDSASLIQRMHQLVQATLCQDNEEYSNDGSDDGLELGACYIPPEQNRITYAGARFELFIKHNGEVEVIKGDKKGIGYRGIPHDFAYTNKEIVVENDMSFYMTTDGIIDQLGGEKRRGFGKKRFKKHLLAMNDAEITQHGAILLTALEDYQGAEKRRDDVAIVGFMLQ